MIKVEIKSKMPMKHNPFRANVIRDTFFATSFYDVGDVRYFRLNAFDVRAVGKEEIQDMTEI